MRSVVYSSNDEEREYQDEERRLEERTTAIYYNASMMDDDGQRSRMIYNKSREYSASQFITKNSESLPFYCDSDSFDRKYGLRNKTMTLIGE